MSGICIVWMVWLCAWVTLVRNVGWYIDGYDGVQVRYGVGLRNYEG